MRGEAHHLPTRPPVVRHDEAARGHGPVHARSRRLPRAGEFVVEYPDGCSVTFKAPAIVEIDPEHDGYVAGDEPAVLIQFDFERDTNAKLGLPERHTH